MLFRSVSQSRTIAVLAKVTVERYQNSSNENIGVSHIPKKEVEDLAKKHKRFNADKFKIILFPVTIGFTEKRIILFRPDLYLHSLYAYTKTIKLSFGFVKFY